MQMTLPPTLLLTITPKCYQICLVLLKDNTWFANIKTKANHDTCHLLLSSEKSSHIQIASCTIKSSKAKETAGNQF